MQWLRVKLWRTVTKLSTILDKDALAFSAALQPLRVQIDALDAELLNLLSKRASVALKVGQVKHSFGEPVYKPEREAQVLAGLAQSNKGPLKTEGLQAIWREIMSACRAIEATTTVAFLGPRGTYSEQAVLQQFGHSVALLPCASIDEVFRATAAGAANFGVVPIENSTEGVINRTLDLLLDTPLCISAEIALPIHHNLLSQTEEMKGVTTVVSHAQSLAQCQAWLNTFAPHLQRVPVASNGEAARMAAADSSLAAIAGTAAQTEYGLHAVATRIQDDPHNRTRFGVVGTHKTTASGNDQTSLILSVPNRAGAVYDMLKPLAEHGVSMTRFESRPARNGAWDYYFYVDIAGHQGDASVASALTALREKTAFMKILGSYPI